jgi:YD repeat-containing protein
MAPTRSCRNKLIGNTTKDDKRTFQWDDANRLSSVTMTATSQTTSVVYGADGARAKKVAPGSIKTLFPDACSEMMQVTGGWEYTPYPHMDVKVVTNSSGSPPSSSCIAIIWLRSA